MHFFNNANHTVGKILHNSVSGAVTPRHRSIYLQDSTLGNSGQSYYNLDKFHAHEMELYDRVGAAPYMTALEYQAKLLDWWHFPTATEVLRKLPEYTYVPSLLNWYLNAISGVKQKMN